jgi:hypothetical protein
MAWMLGAGAGGAGCRGDEVETPPPPECGEAAKDDSPAGVVVTNDPCLLDAQVVRMRQDIAIQPEPPATTSPLLAAAQSSAGARLTLLAQVTPPVVGGQTLQAAGVTLKNSHAIVSYMLAGEPAGGALDVIDTTDEDRPRLVSRATFDNADVIASDFDDRFVWYVGASSDPALTQPAFLRAVRLTRNRLDLTRTGHTGLPSYAGTAVSVSSQSHIYVTSGNGGAVGGYAWNDANDASFTRLFEHPLRDARGIHFRDGRVVAVAGTPGTMSVLDESRQALLATYAFSGADVAQAKTTVDLAGGKAFIAAGRAGVQIHSVATGKLLGSLAVPNAMALGPDPSVVTSNSVAVDGELMFVCNGEAGVYVARAAQEFTRTGSETAQSLTLLGQLNLGSLRSANHVAFRGKYLLVATGLGDLMVVRVDVN